MTCNIQSEVLLRAKAFNVHLLPRTYFTSQISYICSHLKLFVLIRFFLCKVEHPIICEVELSRVHGLFFAVLDHVNPGDIT